MNKPFKLSQTIPRVSMQLEFKNFDEFKRKCVNESPRCCINLQRDEQNERSITMMWN